MAVGGAGDSDEGELVVVEPAVGVSVLVGGFKVTGVGDSVEGEFVVGGGLAVGLSVEGSTGLRVVAVGALVNGIVVGAEEVGAAVVRIEVDGTSVELGGCSVLGPAEGGASVIEGVGDSVAAGTPVVVGAAVGAEVGAIVVSGIAVVGDMVVIGGGAGVKTSVGAGGSVYPVPLLM
jgi:hypothetical protein